MDSPLFQKTYNVVGIALFMIGAALYFSIGTIFNGGVDLVFKYLSAPIAILVFGITFLNSRKLPSTSKKIKAWFFSLIMYPFILLYTWPFLLGINAIGTNGETVAIGGPIVRKFDTKGKSRSFQVTILDKASNQQLSITVAPAFYERVAVGDSYGFCYFRGRFGVPYFWRFSGQPTC